MKKGKDIAVEFENLYLVHQNVPGKKLSQYSNPAHILFIPLQGEINISIDNKKFRFGSGHMFFLPESTVHSFESSTTSGERLIVMMSPRHTAIESSTMHDPVILPLSQLIKEILFYLLLHPKTANAKSLIKVMIETLSENLDSFGKGHSLAVEHLSGKIKDDRLRRVAVFIQANLSEKISMEDIAKQAGLSSRNLSRLMLQEIGIGPKQFLIAARVQKAQELILRPGYSVTQVAFEVGYNSLSQFISAFRAQTGQLPSDVARFGRKPKV